MTTGRAPGGTADADHPDVVELHLGSTSSTSASQQVSRRRPGSARRVVLLAVATAVLLLAAPQPRALLTADDLVVEITSSRGDSGTADDLGTADLRASLRSTTWFDAHVDVDGRPVDLPPAGAVTLDLRLEVDCAAALTVPVTASAAGGPSAFAVVVADPSDLPALCPRTEDGAAVTVTGWVAAGDGARLRVVNHGRGEAVVSAVSTTPEAGPADACCGMTLGDYLDRSRRPPVLVSDGLPALLAPGQAVELDVRPGEDPCSVASTGDLLEVRTQAEVTSVRGQAGVDALLADAAARACAALP